MTHPAQSELINELEGLALVNVGHMSTREFSEVARKEYSPMHDYWSPGDWSHANPLDVELERRMSKGNITLRTKPSQGIKPSLLYEKDELERTFHAHAEKWRDETGMLASIAQRTMHPSYLRIIGLGRQAIPLLLEELRERPDHWFWALRAIAGEDPVASGSDFDEAVEAWLRWGKKEAGYTR